MLADTILANVEDWLNDPGLLSGLWTETELLDRLGEASRLLSDSGRLDGNLEILLTVAGQATYSEPVRALSLTAPIWIGSTGTANPVLHGEARTLDAVNAAWEAATGTPVMWYEDRLPADTFGLYPAPSASPDHYTPVGTYGGIVAISDDDTWTASGTFGAVVDLQDNGGVQEFFLLGTFGGAVDIIDGGFLIVFFPQNTPWLSLGVPVDVPGVGSDSTPLPDAWARVLGLKVAADAFAKEGPNQQLTKAAHLRQRFVQMVGA